MKVRNRIISFVMICVMLFAMILPTTAAEIMPRYNNTANTVEEFTIDASGVATVEYVCNGYKYLTTTIKAEIQLQKKTWWWYNNVDGAYWKDLTNDYSADGSHSIQLTEGGTYKAVITYTVYGSGGTADVITREIEAYY